MGAKRSSAHACPSQAGRCPRLRERSHRAAKTESTAKIGQLSSCNYGPTGTSSGYCSGHGRGDRRFHDTINASAAPIRPMNHPTGYGRIKTPHHIEFPEFPPIPPSQLNTTIAATPRSRRCAAPSWSARATRRRTGRGRSGSWPRWGRRCATTLPNRSRRKSSPFVQRLGPCIQEPRVERR